MRGMKNPHAVALGRKGGKARAEKLSPARRLEIATQASQAAAAARHAKPKRTIKAAAGKSKVTQDEATDAAKRTK